MNKINEVNNQTMSFPKFVVGNLPHPNLQNKAKILKQVQDDLMDNVRFTPDLPTTTTCVEDPRYRHSGMTALFNTPHPAPLPRKGERRNNKLSPSPVGEKVREAGMRGKGFTLIELLVVVLIIGILAAVALPQYRKAILKSHLASIKPTIAALQMAEEAYYLAHGDYTSNLSLLDIQHGCEVPPNHQSIICNRQFVLQVNRSSYNPRSVAVYYCPATLAGGDISNTTTVQCMDYTKDYTYVVFLKHAAIPDRAKCTGYSSLGRTFCQGIKY